MVDRLSQSIPSTITGKTPSLPTGAGAKRTNSTIQAELTAAAEKPANSSSSNTQTSLTGAQLLQRLSIGQQLTALVKQVQPVDSALKERLESVNPSLLQQLQSTGTHKAPSSTQVNIPLYLIRLGTQQGSLLTFAKTPVEVGAQLTISKNSSTQLSFDIAKPPNQSTLQTAVATIDQHKQAQALSAVQALLKTALPRQQPISQALAVIESLRELPAKVLTTLFSSKLNDGLKQLSQLPYQHTAPKTQGNSAALLKTAIQTSGTFSENQLLKTIRAHTPATSEGRHLTPELKTVVQTLLSHLEKPINPKTPAEPITMAELKDLNRALEIFFKPLPKAVAPTNSLNLFKQHPGIGMLLQWLDMPPVAARDISQNLTDLKPQLHQYLFQLLQGVLAKIHVNQLKSLGFDLSNNDIRSPTQQWFIELPLRGHEQIHSVQISIKEEDEYPTNRERSTGEKEKRWQVFMSFELPQGDQLHSQLTIISDSVSATLWADSKQLCSEATEQLSALRDNLQEQGLTVDHLQCIHGKPPQEETRLGYHLVDIQT